MEEIVLVIYNDLAGYVFGKSGYPWMDTLKTSKNPTQL